MNRLAFETATDHCSVALQSNCETICREQYAPRAHAELVIPWTRELMAEAGIGWADIDSLAVSRGPGGFTSLRIGLSVVQGLALAQDLPVHAVSTLDVLVRAADPDCRQSHILALLDARMGEVYSAWFERREGRLQRIGPERVQSPDSLQAPGSGPWQAVGSGMAVYGEMVARVLGDGLAGSQPAAWPNARAVLALTRHTDPVPAWELEPSYVRDRVTG